MLHRHMFNRGIDGAAHPSASPDGERSDIFALHSSAAGQRELRCGQHLYRAGDPATQVWTVVDGSLKTYGISANGHERVTGFFFKNVVIGWEALACGATQYNAVALQPTKVLRLPVNAILDGALGSRQLQAWVLDGMRSDFVRLEGILWMEHRKAEERLASFLLWVAASLCGDDKSCSFILPMPRRDIASYLGLATETVSRRLSWFQQEGWITRRRQRMQINNARALRQLSDYPYTGGADR